MRLRRNVRLLAGGLLLLIASHALVGCGLGTDERKTEHCGSGAACAVAPDTTAPYRRSCAHLCSVVQLGMSRDQGLPMFDWADQSRVNVPPDECQEETMIAAGMSGLG